LQSARPEARAFERLATAKARENERRCVAARIGSIRDDDGASSLLALRPAKHGRKAWNERERALSAIHIY